MTPNTERATAALKILTRHTVTAAYLEPGTEDDVIVVCACRLRFDAGESHAIHQTGQLVEAGLLDAPGVTR